MLASTILAIANTTSAHSSQATRRGGSGGKERFGTVLEFRGIGWYGRPMAWFQCPDSKGLSNNWNEYDRNVAYIASTCLSCCLPGSFLVSYKEVGLGALNGFSEDISICINPPIVQRRNDGHVKLVVVLTQAILEMVANQLIT